MILAFGLRALIPLGFEPAHRSLGLALCHQGFPAHFFSHGGPSHGKPGEGGRDSHCLFCSAGSPAPAFPLASLARITPLSIGLVPLTESSLPGIRRAHIPQARAPPRLG